MRSFLFLLHNLFWGSEEEAPFTPGKNSAWIYCRSWRRTVIRGLWVLSQGGVETKTEKVRDPSPQRGLGPTIPTTDAARRGARSLLGRQLQQGSWGLHTKTRSEWGVPAVAQWECWDPGLIPGWAQWAKDLVLPKLWHKLSLKLRSDPWPGNAMCRRAAEKKKKKGKKMSE